jgi:hypothetical protein
MDLKSIKERTIACFSISAKSQNRLDIMLKWLSELKTKKWIFIPLFIYFNYITYKNIINNYW